MDARRLAVPAALLGAANALVFVGFEWVVKDGTHWLWDDLAGTGTARWRVVPLAIVLSIAYSLVLRALREPRVTKVEAHTGIDLDDPAPPTFRRVWVILAIGATGLLAGASLGPEMPLFAFSAAFGAWIASRARSEVSKLLVLCSLAALLVAFFGSLVPLLIPALILFRRQRQAFFGAIVPVLLSGVVAYGVVTLLTSHAKGYGTIPAGSGVDAKDYFVAFALGIGVVPLAAALRFAVERLNHVTLDLDRRAPWVVGAAVFGAVLGMLYLVGGETDQFSGSQGSELLLERRGQYAAVAVAGIVVVKLLATSWSLTTGYRGGLVFPSVFMGVGVALVVVDAVGSAAGPGVTVGAVAGILTAMTSPVLGPVMLVALLPFSAVGVGLAGAAGAVVGDKLFIRLGLLPAPAPAGAPAPAPDPA